MIYGIEVILSIKNHVKTQRKERGIIVISGDARYFVLKICGRSVCVCVCFVSVCLILCRDVTFPTTNNQQ